MLAVPVIVGPFAELIAVAMSIRGIRLAETAVLAESGGGLTRNEQMLLFLAGSDKPSDPIRIMKGVFLYAQECEHGRLPKQTERFAFIPDNFGPCSSHVYRALDSLVEGGLIEEQPVAGESWCRYAVTPAGAARASALNQKADKKTSGYLAKVRAWTDAQSFTSLLRSVYHAYPEFAKNSVLPHLRPNG